MLIIQGFEKQAMFLYCSVGIITWHRKTVQPRTKKSER